MVRALLCLLLLTAPAAASGLYEAQVIVTGTGLTGRPAGLAACLAQVLAKVSGNPALAADSRVSALDPNPLLRSLAYLDRMSDQPKHDELGTRDRPYDLVARFHPVGIDAALRTLGETPWVPPRPDVVIGITVQPRSGPAMPLRADTDVDERHRAALLAAADRFGLYVLLPLAAGPPPPAPPDAAVLQGSLAWSEAAAGWAGTWRLSWAGRDTAWAVTGVSFDEAYRDALGGAALVLSGHPKTLQ